MDTVSFLAANLFCYRPEHVLSGAYLFDKWDPALVETIGESLSSQADGMRIDLQTSQYSELTPLFKTTFEVCFPFCSAFAVKNMVIWYGYITQHLTHYGHEVMQVVNFLWTLERVLVPV